jgi:hypothetical protein
MIHCKGPRIQPRDKAFRTAQCAVDEIIMVDEPSEASNAWVESAVRSFEGSWATNQKGVASVGDACEQSLRPHNNASDQRRWPSHRDASEGAEH